MCIRDRLQTAYTQRFNARHRMRGHLFAGRYHAMVVEAENAPPEISRNNVFFIVFDYSDNGRQFKDFESGVNKE